MAPCVRPAHTCMPMTAPALVLALVLAAGKGLELV